jgi:UDP-3-O-acyl-N-acetylglucosamine deacetylase
LRALEKSKSFSLRKPLCFQQAHRVALLEPAEQISWYVPGARFEARHMSFEREIAPARTFAQKADIEAMQAMGLLKGIHEGCGVLMEQNRAVNTNLRFNNECARHKLLDAMGDFALLGAPLLARIYIVNGSHSFHRLVLSQVVRSIDAHSSNRDC